MAWADDVIMPDGDIGVAAPNLSYGTGANDHACATRGQPVAGSIRVSYNGTGVDPAHHFTPGESLTVTLTPSSGSDITASTGSVPDVPSSWGSSNGDAFSIPISTTVAPGSTGGSVDVTVTGDASGYSAGDGSGSGRPHYVVNVDCPSAPSDTTAPSVQLSHVPDGNAGWNRTDPVTVTVTATDDIGVTSVACTDAVDSGSPAPIALSATGTLSVSGDGIHQLSCTAYDAAGNHGTGTDVVKLDATAPTIAYASTAPASFAGTDAGGANWYNTNVVVTWSCTDATSGPVDSSVTRTLSTEGANQSATQTCYDVAGNSASDTQTGINVDKTAPALNISGPASGSFDVCSIPSRPTSSPTDALSGVNPATVSDSWTTPGALGLGTWTYSSSASDYATNASSETRTYVANRYGGAFGGILQPINGDGSSRFKLGSTVPVKFQLLCGTTPISNAVATLTVKQGDSAPDPGVDEAISTSAATTGNLFRYDPTAQQYIFNLSTKLGYLNPDGSKASFSPGTWTLTVNLGDGTYRNVKVQLVR